MDIKKVRLGKTGLMVTKTAMGCLPIQRISMDTAKILLRKAYLVKFVYDSFLYLRRDTSGIGYL